MICSIEIGEYDDRNRLRHTEIPNPTWERFVETFRTVQKRERRFAGLTVNAEDGSYLMIDGSDGLFFVLFERSNGSQFQPLDPTQPDESATILCGGVHTTLPRACLFDEMMLLRTVQDFWQGQLDVSAGWEPL